MNPRSTAGLTLKIFNYEFLWFHTERSLLEDGRSSILKELDNHLLLGEFDYSQHELPPKTSPAPAPAPVGASLLAMVVNDNAQCLDERGG